MTLFLLLSLVYFSRMILKTVFFLVALRFWVIILMHSIGRKTHYFYNSKTSASGDRKKKKKKKNGLHILNQHRKILIIKIYFKNVIKLKYHPNI